MPSYREENAPRTNAEQSETADEFRVSFESLILRDLARAKAVFQMRAIEAIIKGGGNGR